MKLLGTVQVKNGVLLLDDSKISVLGGEVDHLVEKWELQRVRGSFAYFFLLKTMKNLLQTLATAGLSLLYSGVIIFHCVVKSDVPSVVQPCRVWLNTAGATLEQKVDRLPFYRLVR